MAIKKFTHKQSVAALEDMALQSKYMAESGDPALTIAGRNMQIISTILLQLISAMPSDAFNKLKIVGAKGEVEAETEENED